MVLFYLHAEYQKWQASNSPEERQHLNVKQIRGAEGVKVYVLKC